MKMIHWDTFSNDNYSTVGGDVGLARYEPALLSPLPTIRVLSVVGLVLIPLHFCVQRCETHSTRTVWTAQMASKGYIT